MTSGRLLGCRRIAGLLLIVMVALGFPVFARAQNTSTEEPLPATEEAAFAGVAASATPERSLPVGVLAASIEWATVETLRSAFTFAVPLESISEAILTIEQPGWSGSPLELTIDPQEFASPAATAEDFVHLWEVDPDNPPALFTHTVITWSFTLDDETTVEIPFRLLYADPRTDWIPVYTEPDQVLVVVPRDRYSAASLITQLEPVAALLQANTGQAPQVSSVLFDPRLPLDPCQTNDEGNPAAIAPESQAEVPCDVATITAIYATYDYVPLELPSADLSSALNSISSHWFADIYLPLWEESDSDIPLWFQAGLERYYWPTPKIDLLAISQQALRSGGVIREMDSIPSEVNRDRWIAQSYGMVLYLSDQVGVEGLFELAQRVTEGQDFEAAYEELIGSELSGLIPAWSSWALTRAAESAYAFYPYLPPTPTATASYTRTPTLTATATASLTPSLTATVTGELSPTPSQTPPPSDTPSATPMETLTVTPRSMASLFTPTPPPPDPAVEEATSFFSALSLGLIGLGVVLLISVLAYGFFQRNRL